jgi:FkbM family methyltransferase
MLDNSKSSEKLIFRKVSDRHISIKKLCEVGVYLPHTSNILDFINEGKEAILVEPEPKSIQAIEVYFKGNTNITLIPVAIYSYNGRLTLSQTGASTFVTELSKSPALINDNYKIEDKKNIDVACKLFSEIDPEDIDLISIDTEGSEWYVLLTMISRPKVISIETHGKYYLNPFLVEIKQWMRLNNYAIWFKDGSDSVYARKDAIKVRKIEKLQLQLTNFSLWLSSLKKYLKPSRWMRVS